MPSLRDTQRAMRAALLDGDDGAALALIAPDHARRLDVHRTNVIASLTQALEDTFPVICRLVDARFFAFAAHEFVCDQPPASPLVADYGAHFAHFLADFPPCRELVYLADVARLEWRIERARRAAHAVPLVPAALAHLSPADASRLIFVVQPSYAYLASPWPIDRIWRANQPDAAEAAIDLESGGVRLEIRRRAGAVEVRSLPSGVYLFRERLAAGHALGQAAEAALAVDPGFDVADAFAALFRDEALMEVRA